MPAPLLFVNVGWMADYFGPTEKDRPKGNFGYLKNDAIGHEAWNFRPYRGKVYGYVPRSARINLKRLGAGKRDARLGGVTVIWMARNPRTSKTVIVGWYLDATVHAKNDHVTITRSSDFQVSYQIEAPSAPAKVLPVDARNFVIPTAKVKGNLGQSPVWYGQSDDFRQRVLSYDSSGGVLDPAAGGSPRQQDPELRRKIEKAAVDHATTFYESAAGGSRHVRTVEADGCGWDLEAISPEGDTLLVEVKGLSGSDVVVELTPNEYSKMIGAKNRAMYVVYIVTDTISDAKRSHVFRHNAEASTSDELIWAAEDGRKLKIKPLVAARLSAAAAK